MSRLFVKGSKIMSKIYLVRKCSLSHTSDFGGEIVIKSSQLKNFIGSKVKVTIHSAVRRKELLLDFGDK